PAPLGPVRPLVIEIARHPAPDTTWRAYAPYAAAGGAFVVVLVGYLAVRWWRRQGQSGPGTSNDEASLDAETRQKVTAAIGRRQFRRAGDLLARAGLEAQAAENFAKAGADRRAAEYYEAAGRAKQASHHYKEAGMRRSAAELYAEAGDHTQAAAEFAKVGDRQRAAECYREAGEYERAARQLEKIGRRREAAEAYDRAGEQGRAAELWDDEYRAIAEGEKEGDARDVAERAAELLLEAGRDDQAGDLYAELGDHERAADAFEAAGRYERAAEAAAEAGARNRAADLYERAGDEESAARIRAKLALEEGRAEEAAERFQQLGDLASAAEIAAERLDDVAAAAELYERAEEWKAAAECYYRAGDLAAAAQCAEEGGELGRAAELYREVGDVDGEVRTRISQGDYFRAGRLLYEQRRSEEALETLKRINSRDPIYRKGLELQGDVYRIENQYEEAFSRYRAALGNRGAEPETLRIFYKMGRTLEAMEEFRDARDRYEAIAEVDEGYEDVEQRLEAIREGLGAERPIESAAPEGEEAAMLGGVKSEVEESPGVGGVGDRSAEKDEVRYEFVEEIARGGMGIVYKARDTFLNRIVAVKVLGEKLRGNETAVKYFLREARAAAALSHPNIVTIYDAGEQQGEYYLAMEYVEGETVKQLVEERGSLAEDEVRQIMIQCCRALEYAHGEDVIHRDIKSDNLMLKSDGTVKVMDFGLAKFLKEFKKSHTQQVGTPYYMSPEQIIGENVDFRSDLYGLGCTAFECITGEVPFQEGELAYHHVHTQPPNPSSIRENISDQLEGVILKLLEKAPNDRYQSPAEVIEVLESIGE
ncbi:MAG: protein kinase, partial [Bradymonadaceae bacterium]